MNQPPKGKYVFGMVKVGEKGQIVIPKEAREVFSIHPGDRLLVLGDEAQGIGIIKQSLEDFFGDLERRSKEGENL